MCKSQRNNFLPYKYIYNGIFVASRLELYTKMTKFKRNPALVIFNSAKCNGSLDGHKS